MSQSEARPLQDTLPPQSRPELSQSGILQKENQTSSYGTENQRFNNNLDVPQKQKVPTQGETNVTKGTELDQINSAREKSGKPNLSLETSRTSEIPGNGKIKERGFTKRIKAEELVDPDVAERLGGTYAVKKNADLIVQAKERVKTIDDAHREYDALQERIANKETFTPEDEVALFVASEKFREAGNIEKAADVLDDIAIKLTEAGQFSQASSLVGKMSPEQVVLKAQKQINKNINPEMREKLTTESNKVIEEVKRIRRKTIKKLQDELDNFCGF
jgi:hypothetical protein